MEESRPTLAIVATHFSTAEELDVLLRCLVSLWTTTDPANTVVMVVDDASPEPALIKQLATAGGELGFLLHRQPERGGLSRAINVGLLRALDAEADAVLVAPDVEFIQHGWLGRMRTRLDTQQRLAGVVGARLLYPDGLIQHGGLYFSLLRRQWFSRFHFGPGDLPEAQVPFRCPVSAALQFIRWETLDAIGLYDEEFRVGLEDVDYCLRAFGVGIECIYEPAAVARHLEDHVAGEPKRGEELTRLSTERFHEKWGDTDLSHFVPEVL